MAYGGIRQPYGPSRPCHPDLLHTSSAGIECYHGGMRRRRGCLIGLGFILLTFCVLVWFVSRPTPLPSYLESFGDKVTLIDESGYYGIGDYLVGCRVYSVHVPAEEVLPEFESRWKLSAQYFIEELQYSKRINGIPVKIQAGGSDNYPSLVPARTVLDDGVNASKYSSNGWSTIFTFYRRPLTPVERFSRATHVPWVKWRFGYGKPILVIKDRSSKLVDSYNTRHPDDRITDGSNDK